MTVVAIRFISLFVKSVAMILPQTESRAKLKHQITANVLIASWHY
jgi:hypothetical protein